MSAKVLFVDDDAANLVVCEAALADRFEVLTALDAVRALELVGDHEVGVVVADQRMPGMTGVELLERIADDYPDTIRLLLTAYSDLPAAIDAINRGKVRRYLRKPWQPDILRAEIRDSLESYELTQQLRMAHQRLRESERVYSLGVIVAGIAHELRNPITWVSSNIEQAKEDVEEIAGQLHDGTVNLGQASERLRELTETLADASSGVQRILDIARGIELPNRPKQHSRERLDLSELLRLSVRLVHGELRRAAQLDLDLTATPVVMGSGTQLSQVLLNLLINALHAVRDENKESNVITLRLGTEGPWAKLEVADNGPGIPAENLAKIFEPFFTTKQEEGTGLGLAISRQIIGEHGGTLEAGNQPSGGAVFTIRLPALGER